MVREALALLQRWWDRVVPPAAEFTVEQVRQILVGRAGLRWYNPARGEDALGFTVRDDGDRIIVEWAPCWHGPIVDLYLNRAMHALNGAGYRGHFSVRVHRPDLCSSLEIRKPAAPGQNDTRT